MSLHTPPEYAEGERSFSSQPVTASFLSDEIWRLLAQELRLSSREAEVVRLLVGGHREVDVADALSISSHTVHTYLARIYRKLQVNNRCDVVLRLFEAFVRLRMVERTPLSTKRSADVAGY